MRMKSEIYLLYSGLLGERTYWNDQVAEIKKFIISSGIKGDINKIERVWHILAKNKLKKK
jgi:hypothetical protein